MKYIRQVNVSELREESNINCELLKNDSIMNIKKTFFYKIDEYFDLQSELKLASKSLLSHYFDLCFEDSALYDTIHSINVLLESLSLEIEQLNTIFKTSFQKMNAKQLIKIMKPCIAKDDFNCDEFDLTYEELILLQLSILAKMDRDPNIEDLIILVDIPIMTKEILYQINQFQRTYFIIICNMSTVNDEDIKNNYYFGKMILLMNKKYIKKFVKITLNFLI